MTTTHLGTPSRMQVASLPNSNGSQLMQRIAHMAMTVRGKPFSRWPAWSTGENLMVALVLNDTVALDATNYSILEALERVELSATQLQLIARKVL